MYIPWQFDNQMIPCYPDNRDNNKKILYLHTLKIQPYEYIMLTHTYYKKSTSFPEHIPYTYKFLRHIHIVDHLAIKFHGYHAYLIYHMVAHGKDIITYYFK